MADVPWKGLRVVEGSPPNRPLERVMSALRLHGARAHGEWVEANASAVCDKTATPPVAQAGARRR